jgi:2-dehydro-3-deoxygalactonokinase
MALGQDNMMQAALIIGDWGNSNARLWLCGADGTILDHRRGPGIASCRGDADAIASAFAAMTTGWDSTVPALLAGVVGASFGWRDAGYLPCPIPVTDIGAHAVRAPTNARATWIAPGIHCINRWGEPDTMRGEELQIAGWAAAANGGDALVAMPGTHCKWAQVSGGMVAQFHSAISGELYGLLREHSVMVDRGARDAVFDASAFAEGAALAKSASAIDVLALAFGARARQATGRMAADAAPSFLSGLVIGCDIRTALAQYAEANLVLIGDARLTDRYAAALAYWGRGAQCIDGDTAVRAGLLMAARHAGLLAP